jgi:hypothetical protein
MGRERSPRAIAPVGVRYLPLNLHRTGPAGANPSAVNDLGIAVIYINTIIQQHPPQVAADFTFKGFPLGFDRWHCSLSPFKPDV